MPSDSLYSLSLEQQVGQFFYIGLPGTELDTETRLLIKEVQPGGVIIFGRNVASPQQLRNLLDDIRELLPIEPFFGVDQEGGLVDRLRKIFTQMPLVHLSHDDLIAQDLAPYIELFGRKDDRVRCVMISHGGFPNIDIRRET